MSNFFSWLSNFFTSWKFWVVIPPWDIGVRVRMGKVAAALQPGPHLRIPLIDEIIEVNTRLRLAATGTVTIPAKGAGKARVITGVVAFNITDPVKAMLRYTEIAGCLTSLAQAAMSLGKSPAEVLEVLIEEASPHGVIVESVWFTEDVEVRTYRLLQGQTGVWIGQSPSYGQGKATAY